MNSVKTLSFAIAAAFAATSASAFEVKFDSADVSYGYERADANEKYNGRNEGPDGLKKGTSDAQGIDLGVKFTMDYNLFNKVEVGIAEGKTTDNFKNGRETESENAHGNTISNEFGWKDSNVGKVSYKYGTSNTTTDDSTTEEKNTSKATNEHAIVAEAYFDMFTVGTSYNNEINVTGKNNSVETADISFKAYPTDDIRVGYTRGMEDFAGAKNAQNKFEVESWWLNGMLIAGADYQINDAEDRGQDTSRGIHFGFRPVMVTDKVTFKLGYDNSDATDAVYSFNVTLATYGVASSLKSDDR